MSQSPTPYYSPPTPPGPPDPYAHSLAPARRASVLMYVLGALIALVAALAAASPWTLSDDKIQELLRRPDIPPEMTVDMLRKVYAGLAVGLFIGALVCCILGTFVRKGSRGATVTALVLSILALLFFGCGFLVMLAQAGGGNPDAIASLVIFLVPLALLIWLVASLFAAMSSSHRQAQPYYRSQAGPYQPPSFGLPPSQQPQNWQQPWSVPGSFPPPPPSQPPPRTPPPG